jgi:hypothetical protein
VLVAVVQEHRRHSPVVIGSVGFDELNIKSKLIHFSWALKKLFISSRRVEDSGENEDNQAGAD